MIGNGIWNLVFNYGRALDVFYEPVKIMVYLKLILFKHIKEKKKQNKQEKIFRIVISLLARMRFMPFNL